MKIGITCYPTYGGSGAVATELGKQLARRGHEIHFISYSIPFRLTEYEENVYYHEVDMSSYPLFEYPPYTLALAAKMADVARLYDLDIFHVHYAIPHAICAYLADKILGRGSPRVVTTLHGTDITLVGSDRSFFSITKFGIEESHGITTVSEFLRQRTVGEFDIARPIEVIPNFVDLDAFRLNHPSRERSAFAPQGQGLLLHISNFRPVKHVPDVVRVLAAVRARHPARLLLIGDGPDRAAAEELARSLGLMKDVLFLGKQSNIEPLVGLADVFLLPSEHEGFGLVALEAMASGVPVVGTAVGGLPEVVEDGVSGYLCRPGDIETMAARTVELLAHPDRRQAMGQAGRVRAELFDARKIVPRYENFYRRILEA